MHKNLHLCLTDTNTQIPTCTERHIFILTSHKSNNSAQRTLHTHSCTHTHCCVTLSQAVWVAASNIPNHCDALYVSQHAVSIRNNWISHKLLKSICKHKHESKQARKQPYMIIKGSSIKWASSSSSLLH